nr:MAG TPA: hypothetical protein [Caudoviricetes sp.]
MLMGTRSFTYVENVCLHGQQMLKTTQKLNYKDISLDRGLVTGM